MQSDTSARVRLGAPQASTRIAGPDRQVVAAALLSMCIGMAATYWFYRRGLILQYFDSELHMNVARRVIDSRTPGLTQLGTVWLPVPHLLLLPLVQVDVLWWTGLAGSIVGLACFVGTAIALFLTVRLLTQNTPAAWVGFAVFATNPNMLYLQATALTEPVLLVFITASTYYLMRWGYGGKVGDLIVSAVLCALAVGCRYDGWFFAVVSGVVVALVAVYQRRDRQTVEGLTWLYMSVPLYAMAGWFFYNWSIFGHALEFQRGEFSAQVDQNAFVASGELLTRHNLGLSALIFTWATVDNLGCLVFALGVVGLGVHVWCTRLRGASLIPVVLLAAYPFNILTLWLGQTILRVPQVDPLGYFNIRYGVLLLPAAAFFVAHLYSTFATNGRRLLAMLVVIGVLAVQSILWLGDWPDSVAVMQDGNIQYATERQYSGAADFLRLQYDGGGILIDESSSFVILRARIPQREYIGSFNGDLWRASLVAPERHAAWVVMDDNAAKSPDRVHEALASSQNTTLYYTLVYAERGISIYKRNDVGSEARTSPATAP